MYSVPEDPPPEFRGRAIGNQLRAARAAPFSPLAAAPAGSYSVLQAAGRVRTDASARLGPRSYSVPQPGTPHVIMFPIVGGSPWLAPDQTPPPCASFTSGKRSDGLPKNIEKEKLNALRKVERATADRRIVRNAIFRSYQLWLDYFASSLVCRQQTPGIQRTLGDLQAIGWESLRSTWDLVESDPAR